MTMPSDLRSPLGKPAAEVQIDADLVRLLLERQHPDLSSLPIEDVGSGWDNGIFRLGDELCVRLPRRRAAAQLVRNEQRWLPLLAPRLPLPIPVPVRVGAPSLDADCLYPWHWSICPWFEGTNALSSPPEPAYAIETLAAFLSALHRPASPDAPPNPVRGGPLSERDERFREQLARVDTHRIVGRSQDAVLDTWNEALELPCPEQRIWLHGDLHLLNVLTRNDRLSAVIDFGDLTGGDPATDLPIAWMLFDYEERKALRELLETDTATWWRARGWALAFGVVYIAHSADQQALGRLGERMLRRLFDREGGPA